MTKKRKFNLYAVYACETLDATEDSLEYDAAPSATADDEIDEEDESIPSYIG